MATDLAPAALSPSATVLPAEAAWGRRAGMRSALRV